MRAASQRVFVPVKVRFTEGHEGGVFLNRRCQSPLITLSRSLTSMSKWAVAGLPMGLIGLETVNLLRLCVINRQKCEAWTEFVERLLPKRLRAWDQDRSGIKLRATRARFAVVMRATSVERF